MRNIIGPPVVGDDLYGRDYELPVSGSIWRTASTF